MQPGQRAALAPLPADAWLLCFRQRSACCMPHSSCAPAPRRPHPACRPGHDRGSVQGAQLPGRIRGKPCGSGPPRSAPPTWLPPRSVSRVPGGLSAWRPWHALARGLLRPLHTAAHPCTGPPPTRPSQIYMGVSVGNAAWPIGVTQVGLHERSAREKIRLGAGSSVVSATLPRSAAQRHDGRPPQPRAGRRLARFQAGGGGVSARTPPACTSLACTHDADASCRVARRGCPPSPRVLPPAGAHHE